MKTLTAFYDLAVGPVSFDFVQFLVRARMAQAAAGCDRLHVVIVPYADGVDAMFRDKSLLYDGAEKRWRLWNICIPACQLSGASVTLATGWEQAKTLATDDCWPPDWAAQTLRNKAHMWGPVVWAARAGQPVPLFEASRHARRAVREWFSRYSKPVITVTLRHSNYEPARNTNIARWRAVMAGFADRFEVIEVADTADALVRGCGYAELNLDLRLALYQEAALNVQTHGGAAVMCWFSDAPFVMFDAASPRDEWLALWNEQGMVPGDQLPWSTERQRILWGPINAQAIADMADLTTRSWPRRDAA